MHLAGWPDSAHVEPSPALNNTKPGMLGCSSGVLLSALPSESRAPVASSPGQVTPSSLPQVRSLGFCS